MKRLSLYLLFLFFSSFVLSQATSYPASSNVVDITKAPYFADNTGVADVTSILNQAFIENNDAHKIIFLPEGTYRITNTVKWGSPLGCNEGTTFTCHRYTVLAGAGTNKTVIKLDDAAPGFTDPNSQKLMLWTETSAAMSFENSIRNLTINSGIGNAGATALGFEANNQGGVYNVKIISGDGQGKNGLHLGTGDQAGPMLVKNLEVEGFKVGIRTFANQNSIYFEGVVLRNQLEYGIYNRQQMISIKDLYSYNEVPAIYNQDDGGSMVTLVNSVLEGYGEATNRVGFINKNLREVFLRNVDVTGYAHALQQLQNGFSLSLVPTGLIQEYTTKEPTRICNNKLESLNLPIKPTPDIPYEDTSLWVSITDYGAQLDNGFQGKGSSQDDTDAFQNALNSGASTVLVPSPNAPFPERFIVYDTITIPPSVKILLGSKGLLSGNFVLKILPGTDTLYVEDFAQLQRIHHASQRVLVLKKSGVKEYTSLDNGTSGDVFIEDVVGGPYSFKNQDVWARQFNNEHDSLCVTNDGGTLWVFGMKTEKKGTAIYTKNGGSTEVLGALFYGTKVEEAIPKPIFIVEESAFSISTFKELGYINDYWDIKVRETRNGLVQEYTQGNTPIRAGLFVAYASSSLANDAPDVEAGSDQVIKLPISETQLIGQVNDDGLPSGNCFVNTVWRQIDGPVLLNFSDNGQLITDVTFSESGIYTIELTANDGESETKDTVLIEVYDHLLNTLDHDDDLLPSGNGADANLRGWSNADKNYGGSVSFGPRFYNSFPNKSIFRIDVSAFEDIVVENARLEIEISTTNTGLIEDWEYNIFGLYDGDPGELWVEGDRNGEVGPTEFVTYNNAPGLSSSNGGVYDPEIAGSGGVDHERAKFLGVVKTRPGKREKISFRSKALSDFINEDTDGNLTFLMTRATFALNTITFATKENEDFSPPAIYLDGCNQASHVYVDVSANGNGTGLNWENAFTTLDQVFSSPCFRSVSNIFVAEGEYVTEIRNRDESLKVPHDLTILGGYPAGGGARNPALHSTIISGGNEDQSSSEGNIIELFLIEGPEGRLVIDGVTVER